MSSHSVIVDTRESSPFSVEEMIRVRAYQLYEERGRQDGYAEYDWQQAECDILSRLAGREIKS
jgi:hypothetical protein